jgi:hypothetical protein
MTACFSQRAFAGPYCNYADAPKAIANRLAYVIDRLGLRIGSKNRF